MQKTLFVVAAGALAACLLLATWVFVADAEAYTDRLTLAKNALLWGSILYFLAGSLWIGLRPKAVRATP